MLRTSKLMTSTLHRLNPFLPAMMTINVTKQPSSVRVSSVFTRKARMEMPLMVTMSLTFPMEFVSSAMMKKMMNLISNSRLGQKAQMVKDPSFRSLM